MHLENALSEMCKAVKYLIKFVAIVLSTGDQGELQTLSDLALKHMIIAEKHCREYKDEMERNISETLICRQQLERKIQMKDLIFSNTTSLLELKEEEVFTYEGLVKNAKTLYKDKQKTYLLLEEQHEQRKVTFVGINVVTAFYGLFITAITAGALGPIAIGLQSGVAVGCNLAQHRAMKNLNLAKQEYKKYKYQLKKYRKEKIKLQNECEKIQNECNKYRKESQNINEEHKHLLEHLNRTTTLLECVLSFRHCLSILQGRTEVLQEARKGIVFQHALILPLEEINTHLMSVVPSLNLLNFSETRQLC